MFGGRLPTINGGELSVGEACKSEDACEVRHLLDRIGDKWSLLVIAFWDAARGVSASSGGRSTTSASGC